jgi:hypothetical protein
MMGDDALGVMAPHERCWRAKSSMSWKRLIPP